MDYVTLGQTGLEVSQLCLGTWRFGKESNGVVEVDRNQAHALLDEAFDHGINFFDTSNNYGTPAGRSEEIIGDWLAEQDREDVVMASKVYIRIGSGPNQGGLGRKHLRAQLERTLDRLQTDYLDIYYIHRWDDGVPIEETLRTLDTFVREGKVHYIGASTMASWQLAKCLWTSDLHGLERIKVAQPPYDATGSSYNTFIDTSVEEYLDLCADQEVAVCPYSPLAGGFLTGKYVQNESEPSGSRGDIDPNFDDWYVSDQAWEVLGRIREVASELDVTVAQVALRWLIEEDRFTTIPIVGARTTAQLEENVGATTFSLSDSHRQLITDVGDSD